MEWLIVWSALCVTLFLGGWHWPGMAVTDHSVGAGLLSMAVFAAKTGALLYLFIWVRWTLPRFRYDQLMDLGWRVLLPLGLLNIVATAVVGILGGS